MNIHFKFLTLQCLQKSYTIAIKIADLDEGKIDLHDYAKH